MNAENTRARLKRLRKLAEDVARLNARIHGTCWQCSHPVEDHLPEEQGCTVSDCSCAQVPES